MQNVTLDSSHDRGGRCDQKRQRLDASLDQILQVRFVVTSDASASAELPRRTLFTICDQSERKLQRNCLLAEVAAPKWRGRLPVLEKWIVEEVRSSGICRLYRSAGSEMPSSAPDFDAGGSASPVLDPVELDWIAARVAFTPREHLT